MSICNGDNERKLKINGIFLSPRGITLPKIIRPDQNSNSTCVFPWQTYVPNFLWESIGCQPGWLNKWVSREIAFPSFLLGTRQDSTDLLAVSILLIWGTHWPTSVFEYYRQAVPHLERMHHSPFYFFRRGVHISLFCPPSTCVCMCAVNAGGCVIDLFVQGWVSTSSSLCLVAGNNANTDNSPVSTSRFCIPPYQAWRVAGGRWKITSYTLELFRRTAPTENRTRVASVIGQSVTTRPPRRSFTESVKQHIY